MLEETSLVLSISAVLGAITVYILNRISKPAGLSKIHDSINALCERVAVIEKMQNLFNKVIEQKLIDAFHSPHTPEIDILLDKLKNDTITKFELNELKAKIEHMMHSLDPKSSIYLAGSLLIASLECKAIR